MNRIFSIVLFIVITSLAPLYAQDQFEYSREFKFKNGIYLSVEDFKNNKPSLPLAPVANQDEHYLESAMCMKKIEYVEDGILNEIAAKEVWGICVNGAPYVRNNSSGIIPRPCFYKLFAIGGICTFFVQQKGEGEIQKWSNSSYDNNPFSDYPGASKPGKIHITEYALDLKTGIAYNKKLESSAIIEIIKSDDFFKNEKIKKKNIGMFITQFNKRHPMYLKVN